jgi:glutamate-5-semialdehyde dehydrogenase
MSTSITEMMQAVGKEARQASRAMARASTEQKNQTLLHIARLVREQSVRILETNAVDVERAKKGGHDAAFIDRLTMTSKTVESMALGLEQIATLEDSIGKISPLKRQASGIELGQMRVPLGVIGIIYESRPNVTIDAAALCLKSGNAVILRGGSEAIDSNTLLAGLIQQGLAAANLPTATANSTTPLNNACALKTNKSRRPRATTRPAAWTRITYVHLNLACLPRQALELASTDLSCCSLQQVQLRT